MKKISILLFLLVVITICIGISKFGLRDGIKANVIAFLCALENRASNNILPDDLPVYDIKIKEGKWDKLMKNLPQSGRKKKSIIFMYKGNS